MPRIEVVQLVNREAQTSDTATYRKDLPKAGFISAIDVGIRITNGATPPEDKDIEDVINGLYLVANGTDVIFKMGGANMYRYNWLKNGKPMSSSEDETASAVQEKWFRINLGRWLADSEFGLDLSKYNSVQIQIDYALSNFGTVGTHVITATFTPTILLHQFPLSSRPSFRGCIGTREMYSTTTLASRINVVDLPSQFPIASMAVAAREDTVAEGTDVSDIRIGKDNFQTVILAAKWYNLQHLCNENLSSREFIKTLYLSSAETRSLPVANIDIITVVPNASTGGVA